MAALFANARIVELIAGLVVVEIIALGVYFRLRGRAIPWDLFSNLVSGLCLLLALRSALLDSAWPLIAGWLSAALIAHLAALYPHLKSHKSLEQ